MSATAVAAEELPHVELAAEPVQIAYAATPGAASTRLRTAATVSSVVVVQVLWLGALVYGAYKLVR